MKSKVDVAIIGGGIIGLYTAYELAKRGVENIAVYEKWYVGSGSTFRCGSGIRQQFGDETNIRMMKRSVEKWLAFPEEMEFPKFKFNQTGYLFLLYDENEVKTFSRNVQLQNKFGIPSRIITPEEAKEIVPGLDISEVIAASFNHTDGKANPFLAIYGLARKLRKMGVEINEYTEVKDIVVRDSQIEGVKTSKGDVKAEMVLNAANAWAKILNEKLGINIPIEPYKHQGIVTEPFKLGEIGPMVVSFKYGGAYLTQKSNGGLIGGIALKYGPTWDLTPTYEFLREVSKNFTRIIPALKRARREADLLLLMFDPDITNAQTIKQILYFSYHRRFPVLGYSQAMVRAGALAAIYSEPVQVGQHAAEEIIEALDDSPVELPARSFPKYYQAKCNTAVRDYFNLSPDCSIDALRNPGPEGG
jgi:sarcosine oxidase subunit beta